MRPLWPQHAQTPPKQMFGKHTETHRDSLSLSLRVKSTSSGYSHTVRAVRSAPAELRPHPHSLAKAACAGWPCRSRSTLQREVEVGQRAQKQQRLANEERSAQSGSGIAIVPAGSRHCASAQADNKRGGSGSMQWGGAPALEASPQAAWMDWRSAGLQRGHERHAGGGLRSALGDWGASPSSA